MPDHIIDLSKYLDISKYTIYDGAHVRLSSYYRINSHDPTDVTIVDDPGIHICDTPEFNASSKADRRKFTICVVTNTF